MRTEPAELQAVIDAALAPPAPARRKHRAWTTADVKLLRERYAAEGANAVAAALGRSAADIYNMASKLKIPAGKARAGGKKYQSTAEIDALIRAAYAQPAIGTTARLAERIGRPRQWIHLRARQLGIALPRVQPAPWRRDEDALLEANVHLSLRTIQKRLRAAGYERTEGAISCRIHHDLKLRIREARQDNGLHSATSFAALMGVRQQTVLHWIAREGLPARRRNEDAGELSEWEIDLKRLRPWMAAHAQSIDLRKVDKYWFLDWAFGR